MEADSEQIKRCSNECPKHRSNHWYPEPVIIPVAAPKNYVSHMLHITWTKVTNLTYITEHLQVASTKCLTTSWLKDKFGMATNFNANEIEKFWEICSRWC